MKIRMKIALLLFAGMLPLLVMHSCSKEEGNEVFEAPALVEPEGNALVYEDASLIAEVSPHFYDNHFYRIEVLGENPEKRGLLEVLTRAGLDEQCLQGKHIQKYFFNHSELILYTLPTKDPERSIAVYESHGLHQVCLTEMRSIEENRMEIRMKTLDDQAVLSFQLDADHYLGHLEVYDNKQLNTFSNQIYHITLTESGKKGAVTTDAECCRKEEDWKACMNCSLDDCARSWVCKATALIAGPELAAAFAVSCIGAGPDTWC